MTTETPPQATAPAGPAPHGKRRRALKILLLVVVLAGAAWLAWYLLYARWHEGTDDAYAQGNVVSVVPQTMGTVVGIEADDGDRVEAGQVLVRLDPNDAQVAYDQAVANLAATVRQVRGYFSSADAAQAEARARQVAVEQARADVRRREGLVASGAISREELAHARDVLAAAEAALGSAQGNLQRNRALVDATTVQEQPQVQAAASQLRQAYLALHRTAIVAPVSGYLARRQVQLGQRVQPGATLMTVVPLEQMWVEANFKETDLTNVKIGQRATIRVDMYPGKPLNGVVSSISAATGAEFALLPPQNATGNWVKVVQRVPRAQVPNLSMGMQLKCAVDPTNPTRNVAIDWGDMEL